jgi:hypothetical protein
MKHLLENFMKHLLENFMKHLLENFMKHLFMKHLTKMLGKNQNTIRVKGLYQEMVYALFKLLYSKTPLFLGKMVHKLPSFELLDWAKIFILFFAMSNVFFIQYQRHYKVFKTTTLIAISVCVNYLVHQTIIFKKRLRFIQLKFLGFNFFVVVGYKSGLHTLITLFLVSKKAYLKRS